MSEGVKFWEVPDRRRLRVLDVGAVTDTNVRRHYPYAQVTMIDVQTGWDVMSKGLPQGTWDVIFASHIIEHLTNPDYFLDECRRTMSWTSRLHIKTPNLAAWFNRIALLLGYLPHFCEVSTRHDLGKLRWGPEQVPGGHLKIFTPGALVQLLEVSGFRVERVVGRPLGAPLPPGLAQLDWLFGQRPSTAAETVVYARKR